MGLIWETSLAEFIVVTCILGGGAAWMTGKAMATKWQHPLTLAFYVLLLAGATRFLHLVFADGAFSLGERLTETLQFGLVDLLVLAAIATLSFRVTRSRQMSTQYFWLYERTTPVTWRARKVNES